MVQKKWLRGALLTGVIALPLVTAGCGMFAQQTSSSIDPPQVEIKDSTVIGQTVQQLQEGQTRLTVYLEDRNGYLAPVAVPTTISASETAAQKALEIMVENGAHSGLVPEDFRVMIPQGTQVLDYTYDPEQKLAMINFSEPFTSYLPQDERKLLEAITWTLTAMPGIEGVEIWHEGGKLTEMPVDGFPLDNKLTRSLGINIETAEGIHPMNSSAVTLYFSGLTMNNEQYYVPVTRLVARSESNVATALAQLIEGPLNKKELTSVILPDMLVNEIVQEGDVITVDLYDEAYVEGQPLPSEMLQALVLSITENSSATGVQIKVNGETNIIDDANNSYSQPVGRQHHINEIKS